jgi:dolichyl-phosphate-mannose-protein mannosyltransferase
VQTFEESCAQGNEPSDVRDRMRTLGDYVYMFLNRWGSTVLIFLLAAFFCLVVIKSRAKPIWFDEFFTATVAMQPNWHRFIEAMPPDGNPPLNALFTRMFFQLFGISIFSLRLTAVLSYTGAVACLYIFVRREMGTVYGLLAVMLMLAEPSWHYAFEARPYGLLLAFFMLALTGWQAAAHAAEAPVPRSRFLPLTAMGIGIAGAILAHDIGIVEVALPLLLGEGVRTLQRRRWDWPVIATGIAAVSALLIVLPMMAHTQKAVLAHAAYITRPITLHKLIIYAHRITETSLLIVQPNFLLILVLVVALCWVPRMRFAPSSMPASDGVPDRGCHLYILAASVGALMLVPVVWLAMIPSGGWFFCRYGIGCVVGISLCACLVLSMSRTGRTMVISLLAISCVAFATDYLHYSPTFPVDEKGLNFISTDTSNLPIVIGDPLGYPSLWWYAPKQAQDRMVYLKGSVDGLGDASYLVVEAGLMAEKPYMHAQVNDFDTFIKTHDRALLRCLPYQLVILDKWKSAGFEVHPISVEDGVYEVRRTNAPDAALSR